MADLNLDLSGIKPLLNSLGLGQAPDAMPKNVSAQAPPPMPPTPAQAGFSQWSADPANQQRIANSLTMPGQPLTPPNVPPASPLSGSPTPPPTPRIIPNPNAPAMTGIRPLNQPSNPFAQYKPLAMDTTAATPAPPAAGGLLPYTPPAQTAGADTSVGSHNELGALLPYTPPDPGLPTSVPTPQEAYQTRMSRDMAAHPDQYQKPMLNGRGWKGNLVNLATAGLIGAAGGIGNKDPLAGVRWVQEQADNDRGIPAANAAQYDLRNVKPLQQAAQAEQAAATLAHTTAETTDIAAKSRQQLALHGLKSVTDPNTGANTVVPDTDSPVYKQQQDKEAKLNAQTQLIGAQQESTRAQKELRDAQAALTASKNDPKSPAYQQAQARIAVAQKNASTAAGRLNQSQLTYNARYLGTGANGQALPGSLITDDGQSVGSAFSGNVRPTGTERNKADLANSAATQIADMKDIVQRNRQLFGPGYGQSTEFKRWIGGQSPDAQRFVAARTIAGDHLAGTFGGRSEPALKALDDALGQFKDNPDAALAGLDQLSGANTSFQKAGTVRTAGSNAGKSLSKPPADSGTLPTAAAAQLKEGQQHTFNNGQVWTLQKGKPVRVR